MAMEFLKFLREYDLTVKIVAKMNGYFVATLSNAETKDGCILRTPLGIGNEPDIAISNLMRRILGQTLIIKANDEDRRFVYAPPDLEYTERVGAEIYDIFYNARDGET